MNLEIKVDTDKKCKLTIKDKKVDYLPETSLVAVKDKFKYSDTVSISMLRYNASTIKKTSQPVFNYHNGYNPIVLDLEYDGSYTIKYIVLPTMFWFRHANESELAFYDTVYFADGEEIFKYENQVETHTDIKEVLLKDLDGTNISRIEVPYIVDCFISKCFLSLCLEIFKSTGFNSCSKNNQVDSDLLYRRDLIWMAINAINYSLWFEDYIGAQMIFEKIRGCNGLCKDEFNKLSNHDCGCK